MRTLIVILASAGLASAAYIREEFPLFTPNCDGYTLGAPPFGCNLGEVRYLQNGEVRVYYLPRFIDPPQSEVIVLPEIIVPEIGTSPVVIPTPILEPPPIIPDIGLPPTLPPPNYSPVPEPEYVSVILAAMAAMVFWKSQRG